jgi:EAL domain-containing protein (putative c-di-GMP-specific phosphodiesterase class I)
MSSWIDACGERDFMSEVVAGLRRREFVTRFQAVVDSTTGRLAGLDARPAWCHPTLGTLDRSSYAGRLAGTAVLADLQLRTVREACLQASAWNGSGAALFVRVTVSAAGDDPGRIAQRVSSALAVSRLAPERLRVLVDATAATPDAYRETHAELRRLGVAVSRRGLPSLGPTTGRPQHVSTERLVAAHELLAQLARPGGTQALAERVAFVRAQRGQVVVTGVDTALFLRMVPRAEGLYLQGDAVGVARTLTRGDHVLAYAARVRSAWESVDVVTPQVEVAG